MKKLLSIFCVLIAFLVKAQDPNPLPSITVKKLIAPNQPTFYYDQNDSIVKMYKGAYEWTWLIGKSHLERYYVPYDNALRNVNLGDKKISSTKQRLPLFNGACQVSTIVDNGDGSITVGNGEYHLSTNVEGRGTENFAITGGIFTLTNNAQNYLVADYNGGTPILKVITDVNLINETTVVPVYTAYRTGNILHFQNWDSLGLALANKVHQSIVKTQRYRRESGLAISTYPTRYISLGSGRVWVGAVPVDVSAIATSTDNLFFFYHSGGVWTSTMQSQIPNTQYDNGTNLVTLTANRYAINWVYRGIESQKHLYVIIGTGDYTLAQAQEATAPAPPAQITSHAMLVGKIIIQNGTDTPTSVQSAFDVQFSTATPNAHNDLTGRDVADVHPAGSITFSPTGTYTSTNVAGALAQIDANTPDRSTTNELQTLSTSSSGTTRTITISSGNSIGFDVADNDNSSTNEIQDLSGSGSTLSGYQISLSADASPVTLPNEADGSITNEIQAPTRVGDLIGLTQTTTTIDISDKLPTTNISGTSGYIAKFTGTNSIGDSPFYTDGDNGVLQKSIPSGYLNFTLDNLAANGYSSIKLGSRNSGTAYVSEINYASGLFLKFISGNLDPIIFNTSGVDRFTINPLGKIIINDLSGTGTRITRSLSTGEQIASTINESVGNGTLLNTFLPFFDVDKFSNSIISTDGNSISIEKSLPSAYLNYNITNSSSSGYVRQLYNVGLGGLSGSSVVGYAPGIFFKIGIDANDTTTPLIFVTNNSTERMSISATGVAKINNLSGTGTRIVTALNDGTLSTTTSSGGATNLSGTQTTSTVTIESDTGTDYTIPAATQSLAGVLNTVDKTKIDNIWNTSVQSLSGTTVTMTWTSGINASITITGTTTLTIEGMPDGGESQIEVTNGSSSYSFNLNGSTGYTTEVIMGNNSTINTTINSHTSVVIWRRGSTLYYGFVYDN